MQAHTDSIIVDTKNRYLIGRMKVTLVICTYDRPRILEHALDSLIDQRADDTSFEVLVVDNNPDPVTRALVEGKARTRSIFSYLEEPRGGLSFARDTGFRAASCDWVVYLDDDIRAEPDLVERIIGIIEEHDFDCFGGLCLPWHETPPPLWLHDRYVINEIDEKQTTGVLKTGYAKGALIAFRKSILEELGGFTRPDGRPLGMSEGRIAYGEETRIQHEMRRRGYVIGFDPELKVDHLVHPDRTRPGFFIRMRFAKGRDHWDTFGVRPTRRQLAACFAAAAIKPLILLPGCLFRCATRKNYRPMNVLLDTLYPGALHMGQVKGGLRVRSAACDDPTG